MKYTDEFRDANRAAALLGAITRAAEELPRPIRIMEICGGHTVAIAREGIRARLPSQMHLVSGPGCPVCVTPRSVIDAARLLVEEHGAIVCTFGDMLRVPGSHGTLRDHLPHGRVRVIYSPLQAVACAAEHPHTPVVLLGIGFETTAPMLAAAMIKAEEEERNNLYFLAAGKQTPPAMRALMKDTRVSLDAFIAPGHVTTVIGPEAYAFLPEEHHTPCVVAGFDVCDILEAIRRICLQITAGDAHIDVEYGRSVRPGGNPAAMAAIEKVFVSVDTEWRGLGTVPTSGYVLNEDYAARDALGAFELDIPSTPDPPECQCGAVLTGIVIPPECPLFGTACTPDAPIGPCMVSREGTCAAYFQYETQ